MARARICQAARSHACIMIIMIHDRQLSCSVLCFEAFGFGTATLLELDRFLDSYSRAGRTQSSLPALSAMRCRPTHVAELLIAASASPSSISTHPASKTAKIAPTTGTEIVLPATRFSWPSLVASNWSLKWKKRPASVTSVTVTAQ